jgi:hypothetical protein
VVLVIVILGSFGCDTGGYRDLTCLTVSHFLPAINPVSLRDSTMSFRHSARSAGHIARD